MRCDVRFVAADYCDPGTFLAAHTLHANPSLFAWSCARREDVTLGPSGDSGPCSSVGARCEDPATFRAVDPTCTVAVDLAAAAPVTYGRCAAMYGSSLPLLVFQSGDCCVWSAADCSDREVYVGDEVGCTVANVEVGACAVDGFAYCALIRESCTDAYSAGTF